MCAKSEVMKSAISMKYFRSIAMRQALYYIAAKNASLCIGSMMEQAIDRNILISL